MSKHEDNMSKILLELSKALDKVKLDSLDSPGNDRLEIMKGEMGEVLLELTKDNDDFDTNRVKSLINQYNESYGRLLYSEITSYSYDLSEKDSEKYARFLSNIERVLEEYVKDDMKCENKDTKLIIKIWDHVNLANNQFTKLKISDQLISEKLALKIEPILSESEKIKKDLEETNIKLENSKIELENSKKELYTQLITIVSIFVSILFVMFGGMSLLNNLFDYSEMTSIPLLEMICGGSLIGIIMVCSVYMFVLFILRVTGKIEEGIEPYKKLVNGICRGLGIAAGITLLLWFFNIRNIIDVKRINTQCKVIEQDDKNVTMECPLDMEEANKSESNKVESSKDETNKNEANQVESSKDESNQNKVDKTESSKDKITKEETNKSKEK